MLLILAKIILFMVGAAAAGFWVAWSLRGVNERKRMDKLTAESLKTAPKTMTAVDDLQKYQRFSEAHVEGLKNLIASFSTLYAAMPDDQKKIADGVFQNARKRAAAHG